MTNTTNLSKNTCSSCGKTCRGKFCTECRQKNKKPLYDTCIDCGAHVSAQGKPHRCRACASKIQSERMRDKTVYPEYLTCSWCGKKFPWKYHYRFRDIKFCSRSCATLARHAKEGNTKSGVESKIRGFIEKAGRYCSREEIQKNLHITDKTFSHWKINCDDINRSYGFFQSKKLEYRYKATEALKTGKYYNLKEACTALGLPYDEVKKASWGRVGGVNKIIKSAGVTPNTGVYHTKEQLETAAAAIIKASGHQYGLGQVLRELHVDFETWHSLGANIVNVHKLANVKRARFCSYYEGVAQRVLDKLCIQYSYQHTFDDCRSKNANRKLKFDLYLPDNNSLIEIDGEQHTDKSHCFYSDVVEEHDREKENYAREHKIKFFRVKVKPKNTFKKRFNDVIDKILGVVKPVELLERSQTQSAAKPEMEGSETIETQEQS